MLSREPQHIGSFDPADPLAGYYNDLRGVARSYGSPEEAEGWIALLMRRRERMMPVSLLQLGLGSWQLSANEPEWRDIVRQIVDWVVIDMDGHGRLAHLQAMPHTFELQPPWFSAMAQGQLASLLVRAASMFDEPQLRAEAARAVRSLLDPDSPLVAVEPEGIVLQEYPTSPPSHVLNGWIWALWGLHDAWVDGAEPDAGPAFEQGVETLCARLPLYELRSGWTLYDLYPHPMQHVASPFYHRLHIAQLRALDQLAPTAELRAAADRWEAALANPATRAAAVARKVGFRLIRPRRKAA
jgi:heparosan-N-sulfate-glucuronate 5-epimerase